MNDREKAPESSSAFRGFFLASSTDWPRCREDISSKALKPNTVYEFEGAEFETDAMARSISTRGFVDVTNAGQRMKSVDRAIGFDEGANEYDVGFHRGGDALGFPGGRLNVNPTTGSRWLGSLLAFQT